MGALFFVEECRNLDEWQSFVDKSVLGNIFQTRDWAEAMSEAGRNSLLIVARDEEGDIRGGLLSFYNSYSFLGLNIIPSISAVGGPVVYDLSDTEMLEMILHAFDVKAKKLGALHSFIRGFFPLDQILVEHLNYKIEREHLPYTVILDLTEPIEDLWENMNKRGRWGVRKAEKSGVVVEEGGLNDLSAYHQIHLSTCKRLGITSTPFRMFRSLLKNLSCRNNIKLFLAKYENKTIAGCVILRWENRMWYYHSSSFKEYWDLNAGHALQWHVIKWGKEKGVEVYDFLGIPCKGDEAHPKYGLYFFKTQFGGKIVRHGEYVKHYFPLRSAMFKKLLPIYTRFSALGGGR